MIVVVALALERKQRLLSDVWWRKYFSHYIPSLGGPFTRTFQPAASTHTVDMTPSNCAVLLNIGTWQTLDAYVEI